MGRMNVWRYISCDLNQSLGWNGYIPESEGVSWFDSWNSFLAQVSENKIALIHFHNWFRGSNGNVQSHTCITFQKICNMNSRTLDDWEMSRVHIVIECLRDSFDEYFLFLNVVRRFLEMHIMRWWIVAHGRTDTIAHRRELLINFCTGVMFRVHINKSVC